MLIAFDPAKDAANQEKHGLPLIDAAFLEWEAAIVWQDVRFDYAETRMCALGYIGERLYFVAFVDREQVRRVISFRKANQREFNDYVCYLEER